MHPRPKENPSGWKVTDLFCDGIFNSEWRGMPLYARIHIVNFGKKLALREMTREELTLFENHTERMKTTNVDKPVLIQPGVSFRNLYKYTTPIIQKQEERKDNEGDVPMGGV